MKISEAARKAGVSTATWKYYIREGLLPEGKRLGTNRTEYAQQHVRRVRLVRALLEVGRLSIGAAREVLDAVDGHADVGHAFEAAQYALDAGRPPGSAESRARIERLVAAQDWQTTGRNPGVDTAARALDGFAATGQPVSEHYLDAFAEAASRLARADLDAIAELAAESRSEVLPGLTDGDLFDSPTEPGTGDRSDSVVELMVVGTVMGDALISGLRRIAQEHESAHAAGRTTSGNSPTNRPVSVPRKDTP